MLNEIRKSWREIREDEPGRRFKNRFERARENGSRGGRNLKIAIGIAMVAAGIVFLMIPGPGSVLILVGVALLAEQSRRTARALDATEVRIRGAFSGGVVRHD